ncbi:MAG: DUF4271 domain-containing protein [Tannerella sp.]|jgi:hypothetical protein|nr:DUF4271 domain-containing protein [Tannerella sp.]
MDISAFTGIALNGTGFSNDFLLLVTLLLLIVCSIVLRTNSFLFGKLLVNLNADERRQSITETTESDTFFFVIFMSFQTTILLSIFMFSYGVENGYFIPSGYFSGLLVLTTIMLLLLVFFIINYGVIYFTGRIFDDRSKYLTLFSNFQSMFCLWGISLYLPVIYILVLGEYNSTAYILLIISYLLYRIMFIYRFIYIFFNQKAGFLFFSLYLCALEMTPLVCLYEGMIYIFNIIETNNLWH